MATNALLNESYTNDNDNHLEIFSLIWLNTNHNIKFSQNTQQELRTIMNHFKEFQNGLDCQQYIKQRSAQDRLVLIVSGQLGKELVYSIHELQQVSSIYVFCQDEKDNEQWTNKFTKVKAVIVTIDDLVSRLIVDYKLQLKAEELLSMNIFLTGKSTRRIDAQFVFFQLLIDCILRLKPSNKDKDELISCLKNEYKGNTCVLADIREFQEKYLPSKTLWWYTRNSFFYKTLNAALRRQDIQMIFLYRSYISDIHHQLQYHQSKNPVRVYRGQIMTNAEITHLRHYIGQCVFINSFLSTSKERSMALFYMGDKAQTIDLERVLFQINADPKMVTTKPFADISEHSHFENELEVLFMSGCIFRLNTVTLAEDQIWTVQMTLCSDDGHNFNQVLADMKKEMESEEINLRTFGKILLDIGKTDLAEKYFNRFLGELRPDDPLYANLCHDLSKIASQKGAFEESLVLVGKSYTLRKRPEPEPEPEPTHCVKKLKIIRTIGLTIPSDAKWEQNGITVAGDHGPRKALNALHSPHGLCVDDEQTVYIADWKNHRVMKWILGAKQGCVVAGGNRQGEQMNQLNWPTDVIIHKNTDSLLICDWKNQRVVRWPRSSDTTSGETIIENIDCYSLTTDNEGFLYVSDTEKHEVRRYRLRETDGKVVAGEDGKVVAGGNGKGNCLNQLNDPSYVFVDADQSVYVSDWVNHRVMKWVKKAKEGIVVAGGQGQGNDLTQLSNPNGLFVDSLGTVYVADAANQRVMRWSKGATCGTVVIGGNGAGKQANQLNWPIGISFDQFNHLYVVEFGNHRVQRFSIEASS